MSVRVLQDRSMCVRPDQLVRTAWVDVDCCRLGSRTPMGVGDVEHAVRKLVNQGEGLGTWPPPVGHWDGERFVVDEGRHEYLAALMLGRERVFVAWLAAAG